MDRVISLPMHADLDEATQDRIIAAVASFARIDA
jgi:dTDP-4-amino-4,6-dideoxygalactose transaminase